MEVEQKEGNIIPKPKVKKLKQQENMLKVILRKNHALDVKRVEDDKNIMLNTNETANSR